MDLATREGFTQKKLTDLTLRKELCFEKAKCFSQIGSAKSHIGKFRSKKRGRRCLLYLLPFLPLLPFFRRGTEYTHTGKREEGRPFQQEAVWTKARELT